MSLSTNNYLRILQILLLIGFVYLFIDGLIHLSGIRLLNSNPSWSEQITLYNSFMTRLFGLLSIIIALFLYEIRRDLKKYWRLIQVAAIYAPFHAAYLLYIFFTYNFVSLYSNAPSFYVWMPFYNYLLFFEAVLLLLFSLITFLIHLKGGHRE